MYFSIRKMFVNGKMLNIFEKMLQKLTKWIKTNWAAGFEWLRLHKVWRSGVPLRVGEDAADALISLRERASRARADHAHVTRRSDAGCCSTLLAPPTPRSWHDLLLEAKLSGWPDLNAPALIGSSGAEVSVCVRVRARAMSRTAWLLCHSRAQTVSWWVLPPLRVYLYGLKPPWLMRTGVDWGTERDLSTVRAPGPAQWLIICDGFELALKRMMQWWKLTGCGSMCFLLELSCPEKWCNIKPAWVCEDAVDDDDDGDALYPSD